VVRIRPSQQGQRVEQNQPVLVLDNVQPTAQLTPGRAEARKDQINAERYIFLNYQGAVSTKERDFYITQALEPGIRAKQRNGRHPGLHVVRRRLPVCLVIQPVSNSVLWQKGQAITVDGWNGSLWSQMDVASPTQQGKVKFWSEGLLTSQRLASGDRRGVGWCSSRPFFSRTGSSASPNSLLR